MSGLGRIYQRGKFYWIAFYVRGKERRESSRSTSRTAARKLLEKRMGELATASYVGPQVERLTLGQLKEQIESDYGVNGRRSLSSLGLRLKHLIDFFGADERAINIGEHDLRRYVLARSREKAANASINRELAALRRMMRLGGLGKIAPRFPMLEENNIRQGFLDHGDFARLCAALPDDLRDPIAFLYYSGWRVNEMRGLQWRDVDLPAGVVRLRRENSKNRQPRLLPLSGELLAIIERARKSRDLRLPFVFRRDGGQLGRFDKAWRTACRKIGQPGLLVHDLRRSAIRNMVRAGTPERVAMALSGHRTRSVFERYNIVSEADLRDAMARTSEYLEGRR